MDTEAEPPKGVVAASDPALKRRLNAFHGAALIVGATIGSGIFTNPPSIFTYVGGAYSVICVWIAGAVIAFLGAMVYGEWACRIPMSGGDAPFLDKAYTRPPRMVTFLYSLTRVLFINPGYIVYQAMTFSSNLVKIVGIDEFYKAFISIGLVAFLSTVCLFSNRIGSSVFLTLTLISVLIVFSISFMGFLILSGLLKIKNPPNNFTSDPWDFKGGSETVQFSKIAMAFIYTLWSYDGWANLASAAGEIKNPTKNIRNANLLGISCVAFVYILANVAYACVLNKEELKSQNMLLLFAEKLEFLGEAAKYVMPLMVMTTTMSCCFTMIYSSSRIAQATGEANLVVFPRFFAKVSSRFGTPMNAILTNLAIVCVVSLALCSYTSAFSLIVECVSFLFWLFCFFTVAGLVLVKYREGTHLAWRAPPESGVHVHSVVPLFLAIVIFLLLFLGFFAGEPVEGFATRYIYLMSLSVPLLCLAPYYWLFRVGRFEKQL